MALAARTESLHLTSHVAILKSLANRYHPTRNRDGFVNMAVAENSLMHDALLERINGQVELGENGLSYCDSGMGNARARQATVSFVNRHFNPHSPVTTEQVCLTNGLTASIEGMAFAIGDPGDAFLLAQPYYGSFPHIIHDRPGLATIKVPFGARDPFDAEAVIDAYESALVSARDAGVKARGVILCNPHNPLGRCYGMSYLRALMKFCQKWNLHLISDEIYALSTHDAGDFISVLAVDTTDLIDDKLVHMLWGLSKDFGASGLRYGAVFTRNTHLVKALAARGLYTLPSSSCDATACHLLSDNEWCDAFLAENRVRLKAAHQLAADFLTQNNILFRPGVQSAFFLWINLGDALSRRSQKSIHNTAIMARLLKQKVYLASGDAFGSEQSGWFRIVISHPAEIVLEGLSRMLAALDTDAPDETLGTALALSLCCLCC